MNFYIRLAVAAALVAGAAGSIQAQMSCVNGGNPAIIRVDGTTELAGDILLICTGGTPTTAGQPVPLIDFTLTLNTNLTSRLIGGSYMDALLLLDEPYPSNPIFNFPPFTGTAPTNNPAQSLCFSTATANPGSCNYLLGSGGGGYGTLTSPYLQSNAFTMYAGQQSSANQVTFYGVPVDPPGPNGSERSIRITNIRANAAQLGLSYTPIPSQVVANLTINGSQLAIQNPMRTIAFIHRGMTASYPPLVLCKCPSHNGSLVGGSGTPGFDDTIQIKERSASSFRRRNLGVTVDGPTPPFTYPQNVPGADYSTETGFLPSPAAVSPPNYTLSPADNGTRILLTFSNVPAAVHVFLPVSVIMQNSSPMAAYPPGNSFDNAQLQLIQTQPDGSSAPGYVSRTSTATIGTTPVTEASRTGTTLYAAYEVVNSDPAALETAHIPVALAFNGSTPLSGTIPATVSLAPLSSVVIASDDRTSIPRFVPTNTNPTAGDFDGDSVPDRVWQNDTNGQVTVYYDGLLGPPISNVLNTQNVAGWHVVAVADFNDDGIPDLVWQDDLTREVTVYYYGGLRGAQLQGWNWLQSTPVLGWRVVAAADFNGDGVPDLVWQNDTTREVTIYYMGGPGGAVLQSWNVLAGGVPGWRVVGAADFNGDGVADLVWQNDTTRQVTIYYMGGAGGATLQNWKWLDSNGAPGWTIKAVADVNGDGVPDLLWQNDTTHQATVYYFGGPGGASFLQWNWVSQQGVPGWSIVQ